MTISVVQSGQAGAAGASWAVTLGAGTAVGSTLFYAASAYNSGSPTLSTSSPLLDGSPVTGAVKLASAVNAATIRTLIDVWMLPNVPGGKTACGITVSGSQGINNVGLVVFEVAGLGSAPALDQGTPTPSPPTTGNSGSSSNPNTAVNSGTTGAIGSAPEFVIGGACIDQSTASIAAGFTGLATGGDTNTWAGYQIPVSSGGTYSWAQTAGANANWAAAIVSVTPGGLVIPTMPPVQLPPIYQQRIR